MFSHALDRAGQSKRADFVTHAIDIHRRLDMHQHLAMRRLDDTPKLLISIRQQLPRQLPGPRLANSQCRAFERLIKNALGCEHLIQYGCACRSTQTPRPFVSLREERGEDLAILRIDVARKLARSSDERT